MAHYKALRLVRSRPCAQKNHLSVAESVRVREAFLPVWSLSTLAWIPTLGKRLNTTTV